MRYQKRFCINNFNNNRLDVFDNERRASVVTRQMGLPDQIFRAFRVDTANRAQLRSRCVYRMYVSIMILDLIPSVIMLHFRVESSANTIDETRKSGKISQPFAEAERPRPIALFLLLGDTRALGSDVVPGLSPCWDHIVHIVQSRNIPLDPKDVRTSNLNSMTIF